MKNFIKNNLALIIWVVTVVIDKKYGLAEAIFSKDWQISLFEIAGTLILSYKWNPIQLNNTLLKSISAVEKTKQKDKGAIIPNRPL